MSISAKERTFQNMKAKSLSVIFLLIFISTVCACGKIPASDLGSSSKEVVAQDSAMEALPDFSIPTDITIELFDQDIFSKDMWGWTSYIDGLIDNEYSNVYYGDSYAIFNNYDFYSKNNGFFQYITTAEKDSMRTGKTIATIHYGTNDLLRDIEVLDSKAHQSCLQISGLQVEQSAKEYFNEIEEGLWNTILSLENTRYLREAHGWIVDHTTETVDGTAYDKIIFKNDSVQVTYWIIDEVVEKLTVYSAKSLLNGNKGLANLPVPDYSLAEYQLSLTQPTTWYGKYHFKFNSFFDAFDLIPLIDGENVILARHEYAADEFYFFIDNHVSTKTIECPKSYESDFRQSLDEYNFEEQHGIIEYPACSKPLADLSIRYELLNDSGNYTYRVLFKKEALSMVSGSIFMPGDNIREYLDSYEEGTFDSLLAGDTITAGSWTLQYANHELKLTHGNTLYPEKMTTYILELHKEIIQAVEISGTLLNVQFLPTAHTEEIEMERTGQEIPNWNLLVKNTDISSMTPGEIMDFCGVPREEGFWSAQKNGDYVAISRFFGYISGNTDKPNFSITLYDPSVSTDGSRMSGIDGPSREYACINYYSSIDDDSASFTLAVKEGGAKCGSISTNMPMPGDNVRTFLDAYENGLFDQLSKSGSVKLGTYELFYSSSNDEHTISMTDESTNAWFSINTKGEIVTSASATYMR